MKHLRSKEIIRSLLASTNQDINQIKNQFQRTGKLPPDHGYFVKRKIRAEAPIKELIIALQVSVDPNVRAILCDILGELHAKTSVGVLIACIDDPIPDVRSSAVDALAKIGSQQAGVALMKRFTEETDLGVHQMLALALGAVGYTASVPALIDTLTSSDPVLRGCAAWSLGKLQSHEAVIALERALNQEKEIYPKKQMIAALEAIKQMTRVYQGL